MLTRIKDLWNRLHVTFKVSDDPDGFYITNAKDWRHFIRIGIIQERRPVGSITQVIFGRIALGIGWVPFGDPEESLALDVLNITLRTMLNVGREIAIQDDLREVTVSWTMEQFLAEAEFQASMKDKLFGADVAPLAVLSLQDAVKNPVLLDRALAFWPAQIVKKDGDRVFFHVDNAWFRDDEARSAALLANRVTSRVVGSA
jgi:hypothetical protein